MTISLRSGADSFARTARFSMIARLADTGTAGFVSTFWSSALPDTRAANPVSSCSTCSGSPSLMTTSRRARAYLAADARVVMTASNLSS
jgi:hypothetical protein